MSVKVLIIGAHNDECEFGCGGTAKLLHDKSCEVLFLVTADIWHNDSITESEKMEYEEQSNCAAERLGARKITIGPHDTLLYQGGHETVLNIVSIILDFKPDIVFIHWPYDNHLEHRLVAQDSYQAVCVANVQGANIKEVYAFEAGPGQSQCMFEPDFTIKIDSVFQDVTESLKCFNQPTANGEWLCQEKSAGSPFRGLTNGRNIKAEGFKIIKFPNSNEDFLLKELLNDNFKWYGSGMYPAYGKLYFRE